MILIPLHFTSVVTSLYFQCPTRPCASHQTSSLRRADARPGPRAFSVRLYSPVAGCAFCVWSSAPRCRATPHLRTLKAHITLNCTAAASALAFTLCCSVTARGTEGRSGCMALVAPCARCHWRCCAYSAGLPPGVLQALASGLLRDHPFLQSPVAGQKPRSALPLCCCGAIPPMKTARWTQATSASPADVPIRRPVGGEAPRTSTSAAGIWSLCDYSRTQH